MTATTTRTALYHRPGGKGKWRLFDLFPTREAAFRAVDLLPDRHPVFRLEDVPAPPPVTDPTTDPMEKLMNTTQERYDAAARAQARFTTFGRVMAEVGPVLDEVNRIAGERMRRVCDDLAQAQAEVAAAGRKELSEALNALAAE